MKKFMDKDFGLQNETAKRLFHGYCEKLPIIDYHCHLSPREIYENKPYENITKLWLGADHYKWRQMRAAGVNEYFVTGNAPDRDKFRAYAATMEKAIGNPLYHWSHLELQRYFDCYDILCEKNADAIYDKCNAKLGDNGLRPSDFLTKAGVEVVCTTDDPIDTLEYHELIRNEGGNIRVLPTFRPDKAIYIDKPSYNEYIEKLSAASGIAIANFEDVVSALKDRLEYFITLGCVVTDHGMDEVIYEPASTEILNLIVYKRLNNEAITEMQIRQYKFGLMKRLGEMYAQRGLAMQLHFGVMRDLNDRFYTVLGPDAGIDGIYNKSSSKELASFLNSLERDDALPKTIIYSLNPIDNAWIDTVIGCFGDGRIRGKVQHGAAWWFNDHKNGMEEQMKSLAALGLLGNFVGMLTDSRSFSSYVRHEYFRRIMCNLIGDYVENGEYPDDEEQLKNLVSNISYYNAADYFKL